MQDKKPSRLIQRFEGWASREHGTSPRVLATLLSGLIFMGALPLVIIKGAQGLDAFFHLPRLDLGAIHPLGGMLFTLGGWLLAMWAITVQIARARGTPLPMMPTQALLTSGPYKYSRNPMSLGAILLYAGIALWIGSLSAALIVAIFAGLLIAYLKTVEEKELAARFGEDYRQYRSRTPFLIPSFSRQEKDA